MFRDADAAANARIAAANKMLYVSGRFLPDLKLRDAPTATWRGKRTSAACSRRQSTPQPQQPQQRTMSAMERLQRQMRMGIGGGGRARSLAPPAAARGWAPLSLGSPDSAARRRPLPAVARLSSSWLRILAEHAGCGAPCSPSAALAPSSTSVCSSTR